MPFLNPGSALWKTTFLCSQLSGFFFQFPGELVLCVFTCSRPVNSAQVNCYIDYKATWRILVEADVPFACKRNDLRKPRGRDTHTPSQSRRTQSDRQQSCTDAHQQEYCHGCDQGEKKNILQRGAHLQSFHHRIGNLLAPLMTDWKTEPFEPSSCQKIKVAAGYQPYSSKWIECKFGCKELECATKLPPISSHEDFKRPRPGLGTAEKAKAIHSQRGPVEKRVRTKKTKKASQQDAPDTSL